MKYFVLEFLVLLLSVFSIQVAIGFDVPTCSGIAACVQVSPELSARITQAETPAQLVQIANDVRRRSLNSAANFGGNLILIGDEAKENAVLNCFRNNTEPRVAVPCVLRIREGLPPEVINSASSLRARTNELGVVIAICQRAGATNCPQIESNQLESQIRAGLERAFSGEATPSDDEVSGASAPQARRSTSRPRPRQRPRPLTRGLLSPSTGSASPNIPLPEEIQEPICPYVDMSRVRCGSAERSGGIIRALGTPEETVDFAVTGSLVAGMAANGGAGPSDAGDVTGRLNILAAKMLVRGVVDHIKRQIQMPYIGESIKRYLPQIMAQCNMTGVHTAPLRELQTFIDGTESVGAGPRHAYMSRVRGAASALRSLDAESADIMRDYVGSNTEGSDVSSAINRMTGGMEGFESSWNDGMTALVPCRSIATSTRLMMQSIGQSVDGRSQCEQLYGQTIANRNSDIDPNIERIMTCSRASREACASSCRFTDGTPTRGDAIAICAEGFELAEQIARDSNIRSEAEARKFRITDRQIIYSGSLRQRCDEKQARLARIAVQRSQFLAEHPELGRVVEVNGRSVAAYEHIRGNPESWPRAVQAEVGVNGPQSLVGPGGLGEYLGRICQNPAEAARLVYADRGLTRDFLTCGGRLGLPVVRGREGGATPECHFIRRNAHLLCGLQNQAALDSAGRETDQRMAALFGDVMDIAGCVGMFQAAGSLGQAAMAGIAESTAGLSGAAAALAGTGAVGRTAFNAGVSMLQQATGVGAGVLRASLNATVLSGFTAYGYVATLQGQETMRQDLSRSYASCLGSERSGCDSIGPQTQAYEQALNQTWIDIAAFTVLGALIPGGRFTPEELAEASALVKRLRRNYESALARGTATDRMLAQVLAAEEDLAQKVQESFPDGISTIDPRTGETRTINLNDLTAADAIAIADVSANRPYVAPESFRTNGYQVLPTIANQPRRIHVDIPANALNSSNPRHARIILPSVFNDGSSVRYVSGAEAIEGVLNISESGVVTVNGRVLTRDQVRSLTPRIVVITPSFTTHGYSVLPAQANGPRSIVIDIPEMRSTRSNPHDVGTHRTPVFNHDTAVNYTTGGQTVSGTLYIRDTGVVTVYVDGAPRVLSPEEIRTLTHQRSVRATAGVVTPPTPADLRRAARANPGESVLRERIVRSNRDRMIFHREDGAAPQHIQHIDNNGNRTEDTIQLWRNGSIGRDISMTVRTGTEISVPGPNGQRIAGVAIVDRRGQITLDINGQRRPVPVDQYNLILPHGETAELLNQMAAIGGRRPPPIQGGAGITPSIVNQGIQMTDLGNGRTVVARVGDPISILPTGGREPIIYTIESLNPNAGENEVALTVRGANGVEHIFTPAQIRRNVRGRPAGQGTRDILPQVVNQSGAGIQMVDLATGNMVTARVGEPISIMPTGGSEPITYTIESINSSAGENEVALTVRGANGVEYIFTPAQIRRNVTGRPSAAAAPAPLRLPSLDDPEWDEPLPEATSAPIPLRPREGTSLPSLDDPEWDDVPLGTAQSVTRPLVPVQGGRRLTPAELEDAPLGTVQWVPEGTAQSVTRPPSTELAADAAWDDLWSSEEPEVRPSTSSRTPSLDDADDDWLSGSTPEAEADDPLIDPWSLEEEARRREQERQAQDATFIYLNDHLGSDPVGDPDDGLGW